MRKLTPLLLLIPMLASAGAPPAAPPNVPTTLDIRYSIHSKGARVAEMHRVLTPDGENRFRFHSETATVGVISLFRKDRVVEESRWTVVDGVLRPLSYSYEHSGGKRDRKVAVTFDWDARRITNTINGESWRMPASPNVMDKLLYQLAVMFDLRAGRTPPFAYTVADGGKIKTYNFEAIGEERIKTEMGEMQTLILKRYKPNSTAQTTLWCAPKLGYLPVKVESLDEDGSKTFALLESVSGIEEVPRGK